MSTTLAPPPDAAADVVAAVRRFNRFYTRQIGVLAEGHLRTPFSLAAARVLYELAHRDAPNATALGRALGLDAGYLSRILRDLEGRGLVARTASPDDGRQAHLALTPDGRAAFATLDARASEEITALLAPLGGAERGRLARALGEAERLLGVPSSGGGAGAAPDETAAAAAAPRYVLRPPAPGDYGWVVSRHGAVYAAEYGWDARFEGLCARIVADFVERFDPAGERCWIAEHAGAPAGCVFLVRHPERAGVAKLRLLLVEPSARGLGLGRALVQECTRFAREAGYHTITLWTQSALTAARAIYAAEGYRLLLTERHTSFGHELDAETWELGVG